MQVVCESWCTSHITKRSDAWRTNLIQSQEAGKLGCFLFFIPFCHLRIHMFANVVRLNLLSHAPFPRKAAKNAFQASFGRPTGWQCCIIGVHPMGGGITGGIYSWRLGASCRCPRARVVFVRGNGHLEEDEFVKVDAKKNKGDTIMFFFLYHTELPSESTRLTRKGPGSGAMIHGHRTRRWARGFSPPLEHAFRNGTLA